MSSSEEDDPFDGSSDDEETHAAGCFQWCISFLEEGEALEFFSFTTWLDENKDVKALQVDGDWFKQKDDDDGDTLLHLALKYKCPEAVGAALLDLYPGAVNEENNEGNIPLHYALQNEALLASSSLKAALFAATLDCIVCGMYLKQGADLDAAGFLAWFDSYAKGEWVEEKGVHAAALINAALAHGVQQEVTMALIDVWAGADLLKDDKGQTPLSVALQSSAPDAVVEAIIGASPKGVIAVLDDKGQMSVRSSLHIALENKASVTVLKAMLAACPKVAKMMRFAGDLQERGQNEQDDREALFTTPLYLALAYRAPEAATLAVLAAWPEAANRKEPAGGDRYPLHMALSYEAPEAVLMALFAAQPDVAQKDCFPNSTQRFRMRKEGLVGSFPLHIALRYKTPAAVSMALFTAWQGAAAIKNEDGATPLHVALECGSQDSAILFALIAFSPTEAKGWNKDGKPFLHIALEKKVPEAVLLSLIANETETSIINHALHTALNNEPSEGVVNALLAAHPDAVKQKSVYGDMTPLHVALNVRAPEGVVLALHAAWREAASIDPCSIPHVAAFKNASDTVVRTLIASCPSWNDTMVQDNATLLHMLAYAQCSTDAEYRNTNTLCFTLVKMSVSLTAVTEKGFTAAQIAESVPQLIDPDDGNDGMNHHLIASLREVALYKQPRPNRLCLMHFRDWTTVSHAWCAPSAKLVALTVLLVGETYKRGLLPRLPMDCWYRILNCIPRHALRQGWCAPGEERQAQDACLAILRDAKNLQHKP